MNYLMQKGKTSNITDNQPWTSHIEEIQKALISNFEDQKLQGLAIRLLELKQAQGEDNVVNYIESLENPIGVSSVVTGKLTKSEVTLLKKIINPLKYTKYDKNIPADILHHIISKGCLGEDITCKSDGVHLSSGVRIPPKGSRWGWWGQWNDYLGTNFLKGELGENTRLYRRGDMTGSRVSIRGIDGEIYTDSQDTGHGDSVTLTRKATPRELLASYKMKIFLMWHIDFDLNHAWVRSEFLPGAKTLSDVFGLLHTKYQVVRVGKDFVEFKNGIRVELPEIVMKKTGEVTGLSDDDDDIYDTYIPTLGTYDGELLNALLVVKVYGQETMK